MEIYRGYLEVEKGSNPLASRFRGEDVISPEQDATQSAREKSEVADLRTKKRGCFFSIFFLGGGGFFCGRGC